MLLPAHRAVLTGGVRALMRRNLAARFDAALGVTSSGGFASAWADQSGNGRNLLQATGANQPIHLPFVGTKYGYLPGVAGNYFSTPDSVVASITGDIDIRCKGSFPDWALAAGISLVSKTEAAPNLEYNMSLANGNIRFGWSPDGTTVKQAVSTATVGYAANSTHWVRATRAAASGDVTFYTSEDGVSWTQLGSVVSDTAGAMNTGANAVKLGTLFVSGTWLSVGSVYRAQIYNGIDGTLAVDFDPSRWTSGTTFTASTGETWTINSTGSKPAQIVDRASLLFDGVAHFMACNAFTLNQPEMVYLVGKQITFTNNDTLFDGNSLNTMRLYQNTTSPNVSIYAGAIGATETGFTLGTTAVITTQFNGASSLLQRDAQTANTGNAGASNAGGFTLGRDGGGTTPSNIQAYEALIYNVAHSAATRANIIRALMTKHGVT